MDHLHVNASDTNVNPIEDAPNEGEQVSREEEEAEDNPTLVEMLETCDMSRPAEF